MIETKGPEHGIVDILEMRPDPVVPPLAFGGEQAHPLSPFAGGDSFAGNTIEGDLSGMEIEVGNRS